jgi:hypothetical protein
MLAKAEQQASRKSVRLEAPWVHTDTNDERSAAAHQVRVRDIERSTQTVEVDIN